MDCLPLGRQPEGEDWAGEDSQVKGADGSSLENGGWGKERGKGTKKELIYGKREMRRKKIMERER